MVMVGMEACVMWCAGMCLCHRRSVVVVMVYVIYGQERGENEWWD